MSNRVNLDYEDRNRAAIFMRYHSSQRRQKQTKFLIIDMMCSIRAGRGHNQTSNRLVNLGTMSHQLI
jgi:hypothetical protein